MIQSEKDRIRGEHDYEVNLKAELEIMMLHEKIDQLQNTQWSELIVFQREQLHLLAKLVENKKPVLRSRMRGFLMAAFCKPHAGI